MAGTTQPSAIDDILAEHAGLELQLADPSLHNDPAAARRVGKRFAELAPIMATYTKLKSAQDDLDAARELAGHLREPARHVPAGLHEAAGADARDAAGPVVLVENGLHSLNDFGVIGNKTSRAVQSLLFTSPKPDNYGSFIVRIIFLQDPHRLKHG